MMATPKITREAVDSWPVATSGLPHRACNSLARAHVRTVGDLRRWSDEELMALRSLGKTSLRRIHEFFELTSRIEKSRVTIRSVRDLLRRFLEPPMLFVVEHRYALPLSEKGDPMTLQAIGDLVGRTRERIRQVEEAAWERLHSRLCLAFAEEFSSGFSRWVAERGGIVDALEAEQLRRTEAFTGYRPMSVFRLTAAWTRGLAYRPAYASSLAAKDLARVEREILAELDQPGPPRRPEDLVHSFSAVSFDDETVDRLKVAAVILRGHPEISGTLDGRYFVAGRSAHWVIRAILQERGERMHYREIAAEYNRRMDLRSQKGAGFVLGALNRSNGFRRTERATYQVA